MTSTMVVALEALFFIISIIASAFAIFELRRARKSLSDLLLKEAITWMVYSSFTLAIMSAFAAINFMVSLVPDISLLQLEQNYVTVLFVLIWVTIVCNIIVAVKIRRIGDAFGFKEPQEKELFDKIFKQNKK